MRALDRIDEIPAAISPGIDRHPRLSGLILQRAIAYKDLGRLDQLESDARAMIRLGDGLGYVLLAQLATANGNRLEAVRAYTRLIETFPESDEVAEWRFVRAKLFTSLNMLDWAFVDVTASHEADPTPQKVLLLGELHARAEEWEKAETYLAEFNTMTDQHDVGEARRLTVLMDMNEVDKVAFLLDQYENKYTGADELARVADVRKWLEATIQLQKEIRQAGSDQQRPHGLETGDEITRQQERMKALAGTSDPDEQEELKRLLIRHAQLGMVQSNVDYAGLMLKTFANLRSNFTLTQKDLAREATVQAWLAMQNEQYEAAAATAKRAIELDVECADAYRVAASVAYMTDQMQDALASANQAVSLDPMNSINQGYRGLIHTDLGNRGEALADLNEAHRLDPKNTWIASLMQRFASSIGVNEAAITYQGLLLKGDYSDTLLERCELLLAESLPQLAIPDAMEYSESSDDADEASVALIMALGMHDWFNRTVAFETGGPTVSEVIEACKKAKALVPSNLRVSMLLTDALRHDGQYTESLKVAQQMLDPEMTFAVLYQHIVGLQLALGDVAGAIATNETLKSFTYEDEESVSIQDETALAVGLAADLMRTLEAIRFTSEPGIAMEQLLASGEDTQEVFRSEFSVDVSEMYEAMRPQASSVTLKPGQTELRIEWTTTREMRAQDPTAFNFDNQLAGVANELNEGLHWFTVRCKDSETDSGPSFGYFVKTNSGWRIFPKPWSVRE